MPGSPPDRSSTADDGQSGPRWTTGWQRLSQTFLRPPAPPQRASAGEPVDLSSLSDDEKRARIVSLDPLERKLGLIAAALAVVLALISNVPYMVSKISVATTTKPVHKDGVYVCAPGLHYVKGTSGAGTCNGVFPPSHYAVPLAISLVLALAIFVTVRIGRRSPLAFSTALTGVSFGTLILLVPFVALAGWILLRGYRTQKYGAPNVKTPLPGYVPPVGRSSSTRRPKGAAGGNAAARPAGPVKKAPQASKRYTPKTPPKPAKKR